jgi:hypothetical protein
MGKEYLCCANKKGGQMKRFFSLTLVATALVLISCAISSNQDSVPEQSLQITLRFEKDSYHVGETVIAKIKLTNVDDKPIIVNSRMSVNLPPIPSPIREIAFDITTPTGETYWPDIVIDPGPLYNTHFIELKPGESFEDDIYLSSYFYEFTEVGTYLVVANYQNTLDPQDAIVSQGVEDHRIAWKGELNSNQVQLIIIP